MGLLEGKIAVITGGTRGLGLAIAQAYVREGASVVIGSRSAEAVERALAALKRDSASVVGQACDVSELAQVEALSKLALDTFGRYDVWVNNAGISAPYGPTVHVPLEAFVRTTQTNVLGTYYGSMVAMRYFLPRQTGKLINILGAGDRGPVAMQNAYASSKAWLRNFTLALAKEYKDSGVGIFAFNPGMMTTDLLMDLEVVTGHESRLNVMANIIRMWANPPAVPARRAVWLASPATDGRTGLLVREMNSAKMMLGTLREGLRRITGRKGPDIEVKVTPVQPAIE